MQKAAMSNLQSLSLLHNRIDPLAQKYLFPAITSSSSLASLGVCVCVCVWVCVRACVRVAVFLSPVSLVPVMSTSVDECVRVYVHVCVCVCV